MNRISLRSIFCISCLQLLLWPTASSAATGHNEANWYQVEILIFKNLEASAISEEQWPHQIDSQYPSNAIQLQTDDEFRNIPESPTLIDITVDTASTWQLPPSTRALNLAPKTFANELQVPTDFDTAETPEPEMAALAEIDSESTDPAIDEAAIIDEIVATEDIVTTENIELTIPTAFSLLPSELHEFGTYAERMRWSKSYRMLFHQSWRQAISARTNSKAVIIESDRRIGDYPELQGTIHLSVSRYLHLQTQLWLNMPELPWVEEEQRSTPPLAPETYNRPWQFSLPINILTTEDIPAIQPNENSELKHHTEEKQQELSSLNKRLQERLKIITNSRYPYAGAVLMNQKRRMRSGEEHYIDHPLFGLIIKITPYEFGAFFEPEPETNSLTGG